MNRVPVIGISGCLTGLPVRFDGTHKRVGFVMDELSQFVSYKPVCPEIAIGLPSPRSSLRLVKTGAAEIRMQYSRPPHTDITDRIQEFADSFSEQCNFLSGFIVCAKSPSCGMTRVRTYNKQGGREKKDGIGIFTKALMNYCPWLPVEEDGRLNDPFLRENFIERLFVLSELNGMYTDTLSYKDVQTFNFRHKLQLMSHDYTGYNELQRFITEQYSLRKKDVFFDLYRQKLMSILEKPSSREKNTNVLTNIFFSLRNHLCSQRKKRMMDLINDYYIGYIPLLAPIAMINHYIEEYSVPYISTQTWLNPYPKELRIRLNTK
ncbi:TPA: YbgA family protein [Escherichia coli]|uniref:YbgA family protein n=1 Tax=Escherichia coli TaxID=562 RepID=UPI000BE17C86|nr:DUF523 and DUF1722 domain-containing protein [Escherichia coli]MBS8664397.1 DUF523 and DUF1722 domain-containing protein [Escherichia coli]PSY38956.1 DUF1722 domain-containing protein [Escherichia coli]HAI2011397.1 DUF523 and DUF1722 domain-containing protein [Escherichia coli]HBB9133538.1 DUF523 and DUF1722 domain-containing protein [Escherichia coli]HCT6402362.1 DUF523 and DUF1722 domain-containing protein [Escherichia coli]